MLTFLDNHSRLVTQTLSKLHREFSLLIWEEMSVSIRQATFYSLYVHCCRQFTTHVNIWILCMHTVLNSARSFL